MISLDGSYLNTKFLSKGIGWYLIKSESNGKVLDTYDTFKSQEGAYQTVLRSQIKNLCESKTITPVKELEAIKQALEND